MLCNHCGATMTDDAGNYGCPKCGNYVEVMSITVKLCKTNQTKAYRMDEQGEWDLDDCKELCKAAGLLDEWEAANGENFEAVMHKAAELLGVEILK